MSMAFDPKSPKVLISVTSDAEAATIVTALAEHDIEAVTAGGYSLGFLTAAPGDVQVLVSQADFDRAKDALLQIRQEDREIDWSKIDVGEPEDAETEDDEPRVQAGIPSPEGKATRAKHIIIGVHVTDRMIEAGAVQAVLTKYGCSIKTRLGLHHVDADFCSPRGLILLEMTSDEAVCAEMAHRLAAIEGVEVKKMVFDHPE
jgi:hypothetical protein